MISATADEQSDASSSDGEPEFESDSIQEIVEDLKTDTICLMELDAILKSPILDTEVELPAADHKVGDWAAYQVYCDKIGNRFPKADSSLILQLGKASYERYLRCLQDRICQDNNATVEGGVLPRVETVAGSKFHDSGLGSSLPTLSAYAETVMSYSGGDGRSIRVPPLPEGGKAGKPFECVACGRVQVITNNSAWKRHLYQDLQPWMCLDASCSSGNLGFRDRNDWISHLAFEHKLSPQWNSCRCPLCRDNIDSGQVSITTHLGRHLEEISLAALPSGIDSEADSDNSAASNKDTSSEDSKSSEGDYHIQCICEFSDDNDNIVLCQGCNTWQHILCYYPDDQEPIFVDGFTHSCVECAPRPLDRGRAIRSRQLWAALGGRGAQLSQGDTYGVTTDPMSFISGFVSRFSEKPEVHHEFLDLLSRYAKGV